MRTRESRRGYTLNTSKLLITVKASEVKGGLVLRFLLLARYLSRFVNIRNLDWQTTNLLARCLHQIVHGDFHVLQVVCTTIRDSAHQFAEKVSESTPMIDPKENFWVGSIALTLTFVPKISFRFDYDL